MSRKKAPPRPEGEKICCLDVQPTVCKCAPRFARRTMWVFARSIVLIISQRPLAVVLGWLGPCHGRRYTWHLEASGVNRVAGECDEGEDDLSGLVCSRGGSALLAVLALFGSERLEYARVFPATFRQPHQRFFRHGCIGLRPSVVGVRPQ